MRKLRWLRGGKADQQISCDDVATSLEHLKVLGSGLRLVEVASGAGKFVLSVCITSNGTAHSDTNRTKATPHHVLLGYFLQ